MFRVISSLAASILFVLFPIRAADVAHAWPSPNRLLRTEATNRHEAGRPDLNWDVITFWDKQGNQLASLSLKEGSGIERAGVVEAVWSPDSRFLVFQTVSSGGHSVWHWPAYVYDASTSLIYSIDDTLGAVTGDAIHLKFSDSDTVKLRFWDFTKVDAEPSSRTIDLRDFIKKGPKVALNSHRFLHAPDHR